MVESAVSTEHRGIRLAFSHLHVMVGAVSLQVTLGDSGVGAGADAVVGVQ